VSNFTNHPWRVLDFLALAVALLGWGGNFLAIRYAVLEIPSWTALSMRLCIVGILLAVFLRNPIPHLKYYLWITIALVPGHFGLLFLASQLTSNVSAISLFIQLNPAFALLFAWLVLREKPGRRRVIGLIMAFSAMLILYYEPNLLGASLALMVATASAMFMGLYSVLLRTMPNNIRPIDIIGWTAIFGTPMVGLIAYYLEGSPLSTLDNVTSQGYLAIFYSTIVSSILSHGCWAWLCRRHPVAQVAPFSLLVPIVTLFLATALLGEQITQQMILAIAILCTGLLVIARSKK